MKMMQNMNIKIQKKEKKKSKYIQEINAEESEY